MVLPDDLLEGLARLRRHIALAFAHLHPADAKTMLGKSKLW